MQTPLPIDPSFYEHLISEDELGAVIRAHIHVEASLIEFIRWSVPQPDLLPRLTYELRLRLACALGLDQDHFEALKSLGDIRNSFGHNLDAKLTDQAVNNLFAKLPDQARAATLGSYAAMVNRGDAAAKQFRDLSARDRFIVIAIVLKAFAVYSAAKAYSFRVDA
ncbi:hypothetical protein [Lysobacter terrae]